MNNKLYQLLFLFVLLLGCKNPVTEQKGLNDIFRNEFYIGSALDTAQINGSDSASINIVKQHFNSITPENCMKMERIMESPNKYDFHIADKYVQFGMNNNMFTVGHTLVWHSQVQDWFFEDDQGNLLSRDSLILKMKNHIFTMVGRYKGKVQGWDVVNEAMNEDGTLRQSKYYQIIGPDYIKLAFQFAHEADPNAELYYNDYSMTNTEKRKGVIKMVQDLQKEGIPINGIGMQGHFNLDEPSVDEVEQAILDFAQTGLQVIITELDISVIPWPGTSIFADVAMSHEFKKEYDPYSKMLPDSISKLLNDKYYQLFQMFHKHKDLIERVTLWGVTDNQSWRNYWPIKGRTDYPLLFDREYKAKPVVHKLKFESL